jgi:hypothetical protein
MTIPTNKPDSPLPRRAWTIYSAGIGEPKFLGRVYAPTESEAVQRAAKKWCPDKVSSLLARHNGT